MDEKNKKILVIDDEKGILLTLEQVFSLKNYDVDTAENLTEARNFLRKGEYDLVITDLKLSGERGEDLIKFVKAEYPETGVIVMTGYADVKNAVECIKAGASDYVPKPFDMDDIVRIVERFFKTERLEREICGLRDIVGLYRVTLAFARLKPLNEVLELILKTAEEQVSADGGSITLWNEDEKALVVTIARGKGREKALGSRIRLGERVCGYAAEKREAVIVHDALNKDDRFRNEKVYDNVRSGISAPMLLQNKLIGTLNLKRVKTENKFTQIDIERAFVLAQIAALAISNSRVFDKMKELDELKSHFISTVTHELRTPITSIKASIDLMDKIKAQDKLRKFIEITKRNISRMERLVKDLLNFFQFEQKTLMITKKTIDFNQVLSDSIEAVKSRAEEKKITFTTGTIKSAGVTCDPERMEQVIANLLNNAIKFSPEKSRIVISLKKEGKYLSFSVTDEGKGISLSEQRKIFEKFYQVDRSLSRVTGSFGIGLSIVKQIVELHGGEVSVGSPPPGRKKGARFIVKIPV